jgi:hypothetical protein
VLGLAAFAAACGGSGGGGFTPGQTPQTTQPEIERVEFGRLVDVYGLEVTPEGVATTLFRRDVLVSLEIEDERGADSNLPDADVLYDFFGSDPDSLQPRLLIPRDLTSAEFQRAFDALDDTVREVTPMRVGDGGLGRPFSVVPRNAAIRITFTAPLGVTPDFFVERDAGGRITGLRNTEAVQLLEIVGDVSQPGAFAPLPVRVVPQDRQLVLDPVLLGSEGLQYQTQNNAAGMPSSPDQQGANIRLAIALDGPLALPSIRPNDPDLLGFDNAGREALVRDFRSGNPDDVSSDLARGFLRDPLPLRIVGELPLWLERVDAVNATTQEITVYKNGLRHEIDRGDVVRIFVDGSGIPFATAEVSVDPTDDRDDPAVQHVRVRIRRVDGLEAYDPRQKPGYPSNLTEREAWLLVNAPRLELVTEFTAGGEEGRDDPRNFLRFSPQPLALGGERPAPTEFVSPFATAVVRFNKPVDLATVRWADTFFFAMRDLTTQASIDAFIAERPNQAGDGLGMNVATFDEAKYRTPYLVTARVLDETGSQTTLRLQPTQGFYLDETMRNPPAGVDYRYFLHVIATSASGGIRDLAGNDLDLQGTTGDRSRSLVIPFTVDTRLNGNEPLFPDNLAISVVRRFAAQDEDSNPSYFLADEVQSPEQSQLAAAYRLEDVFGGVIYLDGRLVARPATRVRKIADNFNQAPFAQQNPRPLRQSPFGSCPQTVFSTSPDPRLTDDQKTSNSTITAFGQPIQNPLNPSGARMQTVWREIDLSLSRTDAFDLNLDVEQMYWAPFLGNPLGFDEFDSTTLILGTAEFRPAPCVGDFSSLPSLPDSGLKNNFERNYLWNPDPTGTGQAVQSTAPRRAAYIDQPMVINPSDAVFEPTGNNRFLPLPRFQQPYFVFRDETVVEQGGNTGIGSDLSPAAGQPGQYGYAPYIQSPFLNGQGQRRVDLTTGTSTAFVPTYWNDAPNFRLGAGSSPDPFTGGLTGAIALPLLADFQTTCDSGELPLGDPYIALGSNGWQVSLSVTSSQFPAFRVFSGGRPPGAPQGGLCIGPNDGAWQNAAGGWGPSTSPSAAWVITPTSSLKGDNSVYWVMVDFLRRQTVATAGFVDLLNPHRVPESFPDPRLGPFYLQGGQPALPSNVLPRFAYEFDPPLAQLPPGTSLTPQFRAASAVDPNPWYWTTWISTANSLYPNSNDNEPLFTGAARQSLRPTAKNFPLDPLKAGDAHIRKWDTRNNRNWWAYLYNRHVTSYVEEPNTLVDEAFTTQFGIETDPLRPHDVRYVNWRFVMTNNPEAQPPVSPSIETFALAYRFQRTTGQ